MKTLAEPTLTAVSGEKAEFKVGGQYNIVTGVTSNVSRDNQTGNPTVSINQIDYGIGLEFQPVVLSAGRISLKVRTSVSEPTSAGSVTAMGATNNPFGNAPAPLSNIISIRKRLADTTVELPSGGSMMIAGLVQDDVRQVYSGLPGLSKIPVLGALFRDRDFVHNESELVVIITPYLVRPVARNELAAPTDNFTPASDGAAYFLGRVNRVYGTMQTSLPAGRYHGVVGYIYK
jgi:pilus assembly protein CpaC